MAILTLSLGIGLNAAVFTVVDAALLRSVPYAEPERLVHLWQVQDNAERREFPFAWQTLRELQASPACSPRSPGYQTAPVAWTGRPEPEELPALLVSANFFDVLGVRPALGRSFLPGEDELGGPRAVVLTDAFWRTRLGADRDVVGKTLSLGGEPTTVVGVLPRASPSPRRATRAWSSPSSRRGERATRRSLNWIRPSRACATARPWPRRARSSRLRGRAPRALPRRARRGAHRRGPAPGRAGRARWSQCWCSSSSASAWCCSWRA